MREGIPSLQVLCLRSVGSHACSAEDTFAPLAPERKSMASRLLTSFHRRPTVLAADDDDDNEEEEETINNSKAGESAPDEPDSVPLSRLPCAGQSRARGPDTDLHHPLVGIWRQRQQNKILYQCFGNPATDTLQSYIDALVSLGRMDDTRLGRHFFEEYKQQILQGAVAKRGSAKRPRTTPLGSLSLYNCSISTDTMEAAVAAQIGPHLAILDLTGIAGLADDLVQSVLRTCPHLQKLSLKNGRRLTHKCLYEIQLPHLQCLDLGGCFNMDLSILVKTVLPAACPALTDLHASGLGWTNALLETAVEQSPHYRALSLGFSTQLTAAEVRQHLMRIQDTLQSLAVPFCETLVDNALLGMMGRNLPNLRFLDVRGNPSLTSLTAWYDGRASADLAPQDLTVLGRYSGLTESSVEETKRINPMETGQLTVVLDGRGSGLALDVAEEEE